MRHLSIFLIILVMAFIGGFSTTTHPALVSNGYFATYQELINDTDEMPDNLTSISFVGDVMLARRVETYLDTYGSEYVYSGLSELSTTTALVGNFEATIPQNHNHTPDNTFSFSVDSVHIQALNTYGFTHMNLANNHSFDFKTQGLNHTGQVLTENNLTVFGDPGVLGTSSVSYIHLSDTTVALIGINTIAQQFDIDAFNKVLLEVNKRSDYQIAYIHWGVEYSPFHSNEQQSLAHILVDGGIDAVVGHHPHVVQDIEVYKDAVIFYSLGNFIFDQFFSTEVQEGLWIELIPSDGVLQYQLQGVTSIGSRSVPRFMSEYENDVFLDNLANKSTLKLKEMILQGRISQ